MKLAIDISTGMSNIPALVTHNCKNALFWTKATTLPSHKNVDLVAADHICLL